VTKLSDLKSCLLNLRQSMRDKWDRHLPIQELLSDRWETASHLGFGKNTSCYNDVLVFGDVKVGENCWIGTSVILDGKGGLELGDYVAVSCGVQIYSHSSVEWAVSGGQSPVEYLPTKIGSRVFIGPNSVIQMGVKIGDCATIGAMSFVNKDIPAGGRWYGNSLQ